ncbi:MAG: hypothetical protein ACRD0K_30035 [Egibacteraceae bacterium]
MREIRAAELARALEILRVADHSVLGDPDFGYVERFYGDGSELVASCFSNVRPLSRPSASRPSSGSNNPTS